MGRVSVAEKGTRRRGGECTDIGTQPVVGGCCYKRQEMQSKGKGWQGKREGHLLGLLEDGRFRNVLEGPVTNEQRYW